jgi:hypothetical protein
VVLLHKCNIAGILEKWLVKVFGKHKVDTISHLLPFGCVFPQFQDAAKGISFEIGLEIGDVNTCKLTTVKSNKCSLAC